MSTLLKITFELELCGKMEAREGGCCLTTSPGELHLKEYAQPKFIKSSLGLKGTENHYKYTKKGTTIFNLKETKQEEGQD